MKNSPDTLRKRNQQRAYWKATIDPQSIPKYKLRICKSCGLEKLCKWNSSFTQTGVPEYKTKCNECHLLRHKECNKKRRRQITQQRLTAKYKIKKKCIDYLGGKCVTCGYNKCIRALTFHHTNPNNKKCDVCKLFDRRWELLKTELDKCQLLCFNCHMEEEERLYEVKRNGYKT